MLFAWDTRLKGSVVPLPAADEWPLVMVGRGGMWHVVGWGGVCRHWGSDLSEGAEWFCKRRGAWERR